MLKRIDRLQLAVPDRATAGAGWMTLLGAEKHGEDRVAGLAARRTRYRLGEGWIELLEPDGAGVVADAVRRRGGHLFAAGASSEDLTALLARLRERGIEPLVESGQVHLDPAVTGRHGLRVVISADQPMPRTGAIDRLYEVTNLVKDTAATLARCSDLFGLETDAFVPIESSHYGYDGTLTLFDPERLDRFEVITPRVPSNTMGRFFARHGESLYMAFAESGELAVIEARAREKGAGCTAVPRAQDRDERGAHTLFLHPAALGGSMLGLSRPGFAWTWSGHPERAQGVS